MIYRCKQQCKINYIHGYITHYCIIITRFINVAIIALSLHVLPPLLVHNSITYFLESLILAICFMHVLASIYCNLCLLLTCPCFLYVRIIQLTSYVVCFLLKTTLYRLWAFMYPFFG